MYNCDTNRGRPRLDEVKKEVALNIGERVRARRERLHLSQEEVARRARVSLNSINKLERGEIRSPRFSTMVDIARSLGMGVQDFVEEESIQPPLVA